MTGPGQRVGAALRARRAAQRHSIGLVFTLVFALVGAPASSALRNQCDLCPRQCPMHQDRDHAPSAKGRALDCHMGPAGAAHDHKRAQQDHAARSKGPKVARATCGNHGVTPATVLPPMILPAALAQLVVPATQRAPVSAAACQGRAAEPPDTPPPIDAA